MPNPAFLVADPLKWLLLNNAESTPEMLYELDANEREWGSALVYNHDLFPAARAHRDAAVRKLGFDDPALDSDQLIAAVTAERSVAVAVKALAHPNATLDLAGALLAAHPRVGAASAVLRSNLWGTGTPLPLAAAVTLLEVAGDAPRTKWITGARHDEFGRFCRDHMEACAARLATSSCESAIEVIAAIACPSYDLHDSALFNAAVSALDEQLRAQGARPRSMPLNAPLGEALDRLAAHWSANAAAAAALVDLFRELLGFAPGNKSRYGTGIDTLDAVAQFITALEAHDGPIDPDEWLRRCPAPFVSSFVTRYADGGELLERVAHLPIAAAAGVLLAAHRRGTDVTGPAAAVLAGVTAATIAADRPAIETLGTLAGAEHVPLSVIMAGDRRSDPHNVATTKHDVLRWLSGQLGNDISSADWVLARELSTSGDLSARALVDMVRAARPAA